MIKVSSSSLDPCGGGTTSNCVEWQGENIECLGIEKGEYISETIKKVADEVCELMNTLDLSDLDLKCVFDLCTSCPEPEKTLKAVLELLINKICSLEEIIDNLEVSGSTGTDPVINLASCFQFTDVDGDLVVELPHSAYTKRIANQVCQILLNVSSLQDDVQDLQNTVNDLQTQINNLETQIPDVSSDCLFVGVKSIEDAWDLLDQAFCQHRTAVGLTTDINLAIAQQCEGLNTDFGSTPGWSVSPANLANSLRNLWIAFCSLRDQVLPCCAITCEDVSVGFSAVFNQAGDGIILRFTSGNGTSIPSGMEDLGSTGTITDIDGNVQNFNITIENGLEEEILLSGLNLNGDLIVEVTAIIGNDSLNCQKCLTRTVKSALCNYCEITASGEEGSSAVIVYKSSGTASTIEVSTTTTTTSTSSTTTTTTTLP